jgi:hypothetical protein
MTHTIPTASAGAQWPCFIDGDDGIDCTRHSGKVHPSILSGESFRLYLPPSSSRAAALDCPPSIPSSCILGLEKLKTMRNPQRLSGEEVSANIRSA